MEKFKHFSTHINLSRRLYATKSEIYIIADTIVWFHNAGSNDKIFRINPHHQIFRIDSEINFVVSSCSILSLKTDNDVCYVTLLFVFGLTFSIKTIIFCN